MSDTDKLTDEYTICGEADRQLRKLCCEKAHDIYGEQLPEPVFNRLEKELNGIIKNGYATRYIIAYQFVKNSNDAGYPVFVRGSAGASLVAYFAGITDINPMAPHYLCRECGYSDFDLSNVNEFSIGDAGIDLPDLKCLKCGKKMSKEGFDIPEESFMGFNLRKEPVFDLNIAGNFKENAIKNNGGIAGVGTSAYAQTISSTYDEYTSVINGALGLLKRMTYETCINPFKIPLEDEKMMSLFSGTEAFGIDPGHIAGLTSGTLGIPIFSSFYVRNMLKIVRPHRFSDLVRIIGHALGLNTWSGDTEELLLNGKMCFSECVSCREDIMLYLVSKGMDRKNAYRIMECVRKGQGKLKLGQELGDLMCDLDIPDWYIGSCIKTDYLCTKAWAVEFVLLAWRLLYFKLYYPKNYYAALTEYRAYDYFIIRETDAELLRKEIHARGVDVHNFVLEEM